jgi:alkanesulfonate monooxygenase SsuD/methylene tetrahydromethanopterin reductase-like flavin-dependent oxidoreductase (luciferase family)
MWTETRTPFHGRYFHVEDAIIEPKPVQKPRPPVLIAGGGEQLTLRAVARLADACNLGGDLATVNHKLGYCAGTATPRNAITTRLKRPTTSVGC